MNHNNTHTQPFNGRWSGTTRVGQYQKKHSLTHTNPGHRTSFINCLHFLRSTVCSFYMLTVLFDNLSPGPLWSSSMSWTLYYILHAFLHPVIIFFTQHMPIPMQPVCCNTSATSSIPSLSLSSFLANLSLSLMPHIHLTILISAR